METVSLTRKRRFYSGNTVPRWRVGLTNPKIDIHVDNSEQQAILIASWVEQSVS
jgi:hypothetical protein